jgi:hypothetical protein
VTEHGRADLHHELDLGHPEPRREPQQPLDHLRLRVLPVLQPKQLVQLQEHAANRGIEIVRTFSDSAKSGLRIGGRDALKKLIEVVQRGGTNELAASTASTPGKTVSSSLARARWPLATP